MKRIMQEKMTCVGTNAQINELTYKNEMTFKYNKIVKQIALKHVSTSP